MDGSYKKARDWPRCYRDQYHTHFLKDSKPTCTPRIKVFAYNIESALLKNDLINTTGETFDRIGGLNGRAEQRQTTKLSAETASSNKTSITTNAGLSVTKYIRTPRKAFVSPLGYGDTDQLHRDGSDEDNQTERTVLIQSDATVSSVSYGATQQEEADRRQEAQDRKKGAYLPKLFAHPLGFIKSELSSKVRRPIVSMAMWAWDLYLRIAALLTRGVRVITWPISHLL